MAETSTRPDEVFASLASALALQTGFGLCFLFSDDVLGLDWLRNRVQEHLESDRELRQHSAFRHFTSNKLNAAELIQALSDPAPDHRTLVWCDLPADTQTARALLIRMNEQRQRLIGSAHFFVVALGQAAAHDAPAWAPDLWSVRTLTFRSQNQSRWVSGGGSSSQGQITSDQVLVTNGMHSKQAMNSSAVVAWKRIYSAWLANPSGSAPSAELALAASHQARLLRQFDDAVLFAQQAREVATTGLGRANALQSLGDLKSRLGAVQEAQDLYLQAIGLFEKEQDDLGQGYSWAELARLWKTTPGMQKDARDAAQQALVHARRAGSPVALEQVINLLVDAGLVDSGGKLLEHVNAS